MRDTERTDTGEAIVSDFAEHLLDAPIGFDPDPMFAKGLAPNFRKRHGVDDCRETRTPVNGLHDGVDPDDFGLVHDRRGGDGGLHHDRLDADQVAEQGDEPVNDFHCWGGQDFCG